MNKMHACQAHTRRETEEGNRGGKQRKETVEENKEGNREGNRGGKQRRETGGRWVGG